MTTKIIGIKEFRQNITNMWKLARKKNIRFIVMHHSKPIFIVNPIQEDELILENYVNSVAIARKQVRKGQTKTINQAYEELGIEKI